jgi:phenylalanyl-tRNA synthetase beta subunit
MSFTFQDETRTLKDEEVEAAMGKIIGQLEKNTSAEIRKQ